MREIKFRALKDDMSNCNFMYGQLVYDAIGIPRITAVNTYGDGLLFHTCLHGTEGQYTGLKDRNGKEIYEGDIINSPNGQIKNGVIKYHQACFWIHSVDYYDGEHVEELHWSHNRIALEVIGNVHENPELLK